MIPIWHGCYDNGNFGDHVGKWIIEKITGQKTIFIHPSVKCELVNVYSGSVLQEARSNWNCFGLGFGESDQRCQEAPLFINSVRGKLSREMLLNKGIKCPNVYFDICELLPMIYRPIIEKKYEVGFIPHYQDYNEYKVYNGGNTLVIDILSGIENVIHGTLSCKKIISTSLHGLILADVYKIPREWERSKTLDSDFKFRDYFSRYD